MWMVRWQQRVNDIARRSEIEIGYAVRKAPLPFQFVQIGSCELPKRLPVCQRRIRAAGREHMSTEGNDGAELVVDPAAAAAAADAFIIVTRKAQSTKQIHSLSLSLYP